MTIQTDTVLLDDYYTRDSRIHHIIGKVDAKITFLFARGKPSRAREYMRLLNRLKQTRYRLRERIRKG